MVMVEAKEVEDCCFVLILTYTDSLIILFYGTIVHLPDMEEIDVVVFYYYRCVLM